MYERKVLMEDSESRKLFWYEHAWAGLPFLMIFVGGMLGGACGGLGYGLNNAVFKTNWPGPLKYIVCACISIGVVVLYFVVVIVLVMIFPGVFGERTT
jgi:hypothetical protein